MTAAPPHAVTEDGSLRRLPIGWGKGLTPDEALRSALGEAIERYCASLPEPARIVWELPDDLPGDRFDPRLFPLYSEDQYTRDGFPYVRFDPRVRHPWVAGRRLGSGGGADVWIPATMVYLALDVNPENLTCQGTSNGLAASTDPEDAALRAILELLERDAFMCAWRTGAPGTRIRVDRSLGGPYLEALDNLAAAGASIELLALPTVGHATTVLCLGLGDGQQWPGVALGLAADIDPIRAARGAILELGQTGPHLRRLVRSGAVAVPEDERSVQNMLDHALFYLPAARASLFDRLREADEWTSLADLAEQPVERTLDACVDALRAAGVRVAIADVTSSDVATGPYRVIRAVSPDLQPISYGYGLERASVARIGASTSHGQGPPIHPIW